MTYNEQVVVIGSHRSKGKVTKHIWTFAVTMKIQKDFNKNATAVEEQAARGITPTFHFYGIKIHLPPNIITTACLG